MEHGEGPEMACLSWHGRLAWYCKGRHITFQLDMLTCASAVAVASAYALPLVVASQAAAEGIRTACRTTCLARPLG
jgi:hypothetical protein